MSSKLYLGLSFNPCGFIEGQSLSHIWAQFGRTFGRTQSPWWQPDQSGWLGRRQVRSSAPGGAGQTVGARVAGRQARSPHGASVQRKRRTEALAVSSPGNAVCPRWASGSCSVRQGCCDD